MAKNLLQDMVKVKTQKKDISNKDMQAKDTSKKEIFRKEILKNTGTVETVEIKKTRGGGPRYGLWFVAAISIIFFIFALSFLFTRASVIINPKIQNLVLDEKLSAVKDSSSDSVSFDLVVISGEESKDVAGGEAKDLALSAKGTVLVYNAFSSTPQNLAINTKLEGSNGKIYKTGSPVTVPGMNDDGVPGQMEVGIYGVEAGEEYNSPPLDFKLFGFKGTPKYSKFYARSKGEIAGGFIGKSPVISDAEKESTFSELTIALKEKLFKKSTGQIPDGFVLFKDAVFLNVDEQNIGYATGGTTVPVKIKGTLYGFLFNEQNLTKKIAEDNITKYDDSDVYIQNIEDLVFSMSPQTDVSGQSITFSDMQNISFNLSGPAKIIWKFDNAKLSAELLGKPKKDFNQILSQYPNVDSANLALSPFWARTLPSKSKDIKIIVNYPE